MVGGQLSLTPVTHSQARVSALSAEAIGSQRLQIPVSHFPNIEEVENNSLEICDPCLSSCIVSCIGDISRARNITEILE